VVNAAARIPLLPAEEAERRERRRASPDADLWALLDAVKDPEIPVLSLWDLGVLRDVQRTPAGVIVVLTPTYSGCPALQVMQDDVRACLAQAGYQRVELRQQLRPAWTTTWLSEDARARLAAFGIAPPDEVICPNCGSAHTHQISAFASTACKALLRCDDCREPFDYFKPF
jgi:ring-1,2-phenylacetyl-CoA epoxidase subunit PaaD